MVVKTKMADISFVSKVRTRRNNSKNKNNGKNNKKTTLRATSAIWRTLAELNNHELNIDGSKLVLTMFLN